MLESFVFLGCSTNSSSSWFSSKTHGTS